MSALPYADRGDPRLRPFTLLCGAMALLPSKAWAADPKDEKVDVEVEVQDSKPKIQHLTRASHTTTREQWETHHAQSAPEALAKTPGVYVQKTAHAQASPYLRGLTGQRTVILFDGIRLNNSTYRQGPNQYFFTVDHQSIDSIEVLRGSASTLYGSDAIGGAILSQPRRAYAPASQQGKAQGLWWRGEARATTHSADERLGGRVSAQLGWGSKLSLLAGIGYRKVGLLQTAGPLASPVDGSQHKSPSFEDDQRTQIGTGYKEHTSDLRLQYNPNARSELVAAFYRYRQRDAPRTDKCPPLEGRAKECLTYKKQDRDLGYLGFDQTLRSTIWSSLSARLSLSRQYEWRQWSIDNMIPGVPGGTQNDAFDEVWTYGARLRLGSKPLSLHENWSLRLKTGLDAYFDRLSSSSQQSFTDTSPPTVLHHSRGQYVSGSRYLSSGAFAQGELRFKSRLWTELGLRSSIVHATVPGDPASDTHAVARTYTPVGGHLGLHWRLLPGLRWQNNVDQGFRAPNLDDLSGRQQVGPGFQFENHNLAPERSWSFDSGLRYLYKNLDIAAFAFHTRILDAIVRAPRTIDKCPASQTGPEGCLASRTRFSLVNLDDTAKLWGGEANLRYRITPGLALSSAISYAYGYGPSPTPGVTESVPLSRVPPLHGHVAWTHAIPFSLPGSIRWGGSVHWALAQTRLAMADRADARIPLGGTPGFVVAHLHLSWLFTQRGELALMLENLFDTPYRHHGSSVNGAGRSVRVRIRAFFGDS